MNVLCNAEGAQYIALYYTVEISVVKLKIKVTCENFC